MPREAASDYLTVAEAARLLGFSVRTIARWVEHGRLPYVVIQGTKLLPRGDVQAMLEGPTNCDDG